MPRPSQRTRSRKRSPKRLPGGDATTHYKKEKVRASHCARCNRVLSGIPRLAQSKMGKLTASQKRIQRIYGGQLCHVCLQDLLKHAVRERLI
ncbi:MAG: 50S ribosomal protein L34e [Candidatus Bathyarchaeia archaeon]